MPESFSNRNFFAKYPVVRNGGVSGVGAIVRARIEGLGGGMKGGRGAILGTFVPRLGGRGVSFRGV